MKKAARTIITFDCLRNCPYCCNKYTSLLSKAEMIDDYVPLLSYPEILITGGEPTLHMDRVMQLVRDIRNTSLTKNKIYLYTARIVPELVMLLPLIDGIHYTIHENKQLESEFPALINIARFSKDNGYNLSFRLYIHPTISKEVAIYPNLFSRVEVKPWLKEEDCPLPEGEKLFRLNV